MHRRDRALLHHTREEVPLIMKYDACTGLLGVRETFADVAATLSSYFHLKEKSLTGHALFKFDRKHGNRVLSPK